MQWLEQHIGEALLTVVVAIMAFFGRREINRIDAKADNADVKALLAQLREHISDDKEMRRDLTEGLGAMRESLSEVREDVARIAGRLESR